MKIIHTKPFDQWLNSMRDSVWRTRISARLEQIAKFGHLGDTKYLTDGVSELRFKSGAGFRVYYARRGETVVLLLSGGDKSSQSKDIAKAVALLRQFAGEQEGDNP